MAQLTEELQSGSLMDFTVHFFIWTCRKNDGSLAHCRSECINQGRYCAPSPRQSSPAHVTGRDIVEVRNKVIVVACNI